MLSGKKLGCGDRDLKRNSGSEVKMNWPINVVAALLCISWLQPIAQARGLGEEIVTTGCQFHQLFRTGRVVLTDDILSIPEAVASMLKEMKLRGKIGVKAAKVGNALATTTRDGRRMIYYDPEFILEMTFESGNGFGPLSILAHEVGHHYHGHTFRDARKSSHQKELEADRFSGAFMQRIGLPLTAAQASATTLPASASVSHPGRAERLMAIRDGWMSSCDQDSRCSPHGDSWRGRGFRGQPRNHGLACLKRDGNQPYWTEIIVKDVSVDEFDILNRASKKQCEYRVPLGDKCVSVGFCRGEGLVPLWAIGRDREQAQRGYHKKSRRREARGWKCTPVRDMFCAR